MGDVQVLFINFYYKGHWSEIFKVAASRFVEVRDKEISEMKIVANNY
jgi:hypothetical protein